MNWRRLIVLAGALLVLARCSQSTDTGRIFSNRMPATPVAPAGPPLLVSVPELAADPEVYAGPLLQITAQYRRVPVVVCEGLARSSPATWMLAQDEQVLAARGFEDLVIPLLPPRMMVTVEGVLRHWRGPLGCGKDAPVRDVWYLAVTDVVSPNPVARVTLTPEGQAPAATPPAGETPTELATAQEPGPVGTPVTAPAASPTTRPSATARPPTTTPLVSPTSGTPDLSATITSSPTPEPTAEGTTATATAGNGATLTPSATPAGGEATATPARIVVDRGSVDFQELHGGPLDGNEMHSWQFELRAGDVITINVAAGPETDLTLAVLDAAGNRIVEQDRGGPGQIERIALLEVGSSGGYRLLVAEAEAREGDYLFMVLNDNDEADDEFVFVDLLSYGSGATGNLPQNRDQFWFFYGNLGDVINVNVSPNDDANLFFDLYGTDGTHLEKVTEAPGGGAEQLLNYDLPTTGLYALRVGEIDSGAAGYTILVARN